MWPLKGSAMPLTCRPMPRAAELRSMGSVSLVCATRALLRETLVVRAGVLVIGADDARAQQLRLATEALQPARGTLARALNALQALLAALADRHTSSALIWPPPSTARRMA